MLEMTTGPEFKAAVQNAKARGDAARKKKRPNATRDWSPQELCLKKFRANLVLANLAQQARDLEGGGGNWRAQLKEKSRLQATRKQLLLALAPTSYWGKEGDRQKVHCPRDEISPFTPQARKEATALKRKGVERFEPMAGRAMKAWVLVPVEHSRAWAKLAEQAFAALP